MVGGPQTTMASTGDVEDLLALTTAFFEETLWTSEIGASVRGWLRRWGVTDDTLHAFGVGYAPGKPNWLSERLDRWGCSEADLIAAGIANQSARGGAHAWFHARIMFPISREDGSTIGFAGLATHLGPSWPLWLASPTVGPFDRGSAMFALDRAAPAIARGGRALIVRDCVEALTLHQQGRDETVAVVQSPITRVHTARLAAAMGCGRVALARRDGLLGVVAARAGEAVAEEAFASRKTPNGFALIHEHRKPRPPKPSRPVVPADPASTRRRPPTRLAVYFAGGIVGAGLPFGLLSLAGRGDTTVGGRASALNLTILGLAAFYALLAFGVARFSARTRAGEGTRRMRLPWVRGSGEVQPSGWTYHGLEDALVGAALVSIFILFALLFTVGGFFG